MKVVCDSRERGRWLAERMLRVCGSEVAAMLGEGKGENNTRAQLVMLKAGLAEPWSGNETSETGRDMEDSGFFALRARRKWGWELQPCGLLTEDPVCSVHAATPDFLLTTPWGTAVVNAKTTTSQAREDVKPRRDGKPSEAAYAHWIPMHIQLQLQSEMAATGTRLSAALVLHASGGEFKLRAYWMPRHEPVIALIRAEAVRLMAEVESLKAGRNECQSW
jgi:predicted phage-related endonuclease